MTKGSYPANYAEYKQRFIDIIVDGFKHNPSVVDVVKQDARKLERTRKLAEYSFHFGERRNGNYLTSDGNGVVIAYVEDMKRTLADHWANFKLVLQVIGLKKALYMLRKEAYRKKVRPQEPFFYVWFIGIDEKHRGGECAKELRRWVFEEADKHGLPILQETTIDKNKRVYEYFGFEVYHVHQFNKEMPPTYFMRREVKGS